MIELLSLLYEAQRRLAVIAVEHPKLATRTIGNSDEAVSLLSLLIDVCEHIEGNIHAGD